MLIQPDTQPYHALTYPYLGRLKTNLGEPYITVLFTKPGVGTVMFSNKEGISQGQFQTNWDENQFIQIQQ